MTRKKAEEPTAKKAVSARNNAFRESQEACYAQRIPNSAQVLEASTTEQLWSRNRGCRERGRSLL